MGAFSRSLFGCLITLLFVTILGTREAAAQFVRFEQHGTAEGLGNLAVTSIGQNTDGAILVGTEGGLYRYDGAMFHPYADDVLPGSIWIHQILLDGQGRLWLSTGDGVFVRHKNGSMTRVVTSRVANDLISAYSIAEAGDSMVFDVDGTVQTASTLTATPGLSRPMFDAAVLARVPALKHVAFVQSDAAGGVLLGCGDQICDANGGKLSLFGTAEGLPKETWYAAVVSQDGTVWARSLAHLAWRRSGERSFSTVDIPGDAQSFFEGHPTDIDLTTDRHGDVFTESDDGVLEWTGRSWRTFSHHVGGLPSNIAHAIFFDREGSLWVGSEGGGVSRALGLGKWEHWTFDDGLPNNTVWSMAQTPDGPVWATTDHGTVELGGRHRRLPGSNYAIAVTKEGRVWIDPFGQPLERLDNDAAAPQLFQSVPNALNAVVDREDRLWIATRTEIAVIDNADAPAGNIKPHVVLSGSQFEVGLDRSGSVWAEDQTRLFHQGSGEQMLAVPLPAGKPFRPTDFTFAQDGSLWIGTDSSGVIRFRVDSGRLTALPRLGAPQIASNSILFIRRDNRGWIWVGTDHGINVVAGKSIIHFDSSDGPLSNDLDQESILAGRDGSMWFGTSSGLSHLVDPTHLATVSALHPQVTSITYGDYSATLNHHLDTPWTSAPLVIRFDDFEYQTGPLLFRYKLNGVDTHWTETSAREVRYANVPAGRLAFEMYAVDASHSRVSRPVIVSIRIRPPWWRQWWFYLIVWLAGVGLIASAWWARMGYLVRQRAQLEELVHCRTTEIEAANERLARQSALEQRRLEEMVRVRTAEIEIARQELHRLALSDALTGLPNRRAVLAELDDWLATPCPDGRTVAALLLDVDRFKMVNDRYGHLAGDEVLAQYGARLAAAIQPDEVAARYGGEEFLIILRGHDETLQDRAKAIWQSVSQHGYVFAGAARSVTASAGLATLRTGEQSTSLIERADAALYKAKANGRARFEIGDVAGSSIVVACQATDTAQPDYRAQLRGALAADEFTLVYQPIVDVRRQVVVSCEALLRWDSAIHGPVSPAVFVPLAEEIGVMPEIGAWVLREACREAATWVSGPGVSVNLSPSQLDDPQLVQQVADALRDSNLAAARLELEVTESAMIDDIPGARRVLNELRGLGLSIALDDFGTGFSSLSFLQTLPFDRIKVDKSFVTELGFSSRSLAIVRSLVSLCHGLGAKITAEGVETNFQAELLVAAGCSELQGYLLGRPSPASQLREWLRARDEEGGRSPAFVVETSRSRTFAGELAEHPL